MINKDQITSYVKELMGTEPGLLFPGIDRNSWGNLYGGTLGVSIFLSEYGLLTNEQSVIDKALDFLNYNRSTNSFNHLGLIDGPSAKIYSNYVIGGAHQIQTLIDEAVDISAIGFDAVENQTNPLDLLSGTTGYLLAISRLYSLAKSDLLKKRISDTVAVVYESLRIQTLPDFKNGNLLTGMGHGLSGVSLAFSAAYKATKNTLSAKAVKMAIELENQTFEKNYWPDYRYNPPRASNAWCHGFVGIGLSRSELLVANLCKKQAKQDLLLCINEIIGNPHSEIDQLCCGTLGRIELLVSASKIFDVEDFLLFARKNGKQLLEKSLREGHFMNGNKLEINTPELFQGLSGIYYEFLRLNHPDRIRNILIFE